MRCRVLKLVDECFGKVGACLNEVTLESSIDIFVRPVTSDYRF